MSDWAVILGMVFNVGIVVATFRERLKSMDESLKEINHKVGRQDTTLDNHSCRLSVLEAQCEQCKKT